MNDKIFLIDDDADFRMIFEQKIRSWGYDVESFENRQSLSEHIADSEPDVVLLDVNLGGESGLELIEFIRSHHPETPIIMLSGQDETETIVSAMSTGASDYVTKPFDDQSLKSKIFEHLARIRQKQTASNIRGAFGDKMIIGESARTRQLVHEMSKVAHSDATVFLRGESGTGKSLIAELIHEHSHRHEHPFVTINCSAIPENLIESELFGHVKGAFTGASADKIGKFEYADGGTVFLDEIGELNADLQVKILRVLQSQEFERVGDVKTRKVDVRIVSATNRNLEKAIFEGKFREDLFYRLNVLPIHVPSLRDRKEDIESLVQHFVSLYSKKADKHFNDLPHTIMSHLVDYNWPGNIRELQNVVERAVILGKEPHLKLTDFVINTAPLPDYSRQASLVTPSVTSVQDLEYRALIKAIEEASGNMSKAAKLLGIGRDTLYRRLKKYGIQTKTQRAQAAKS